MLLWNRLLFIVVAGWQYKFALLSHDKVIRCRSRRFHCLLQVFFRRWGWLVPAQHYVSWWSAAIGAFRSGYCFRTMVSSGVLWFAVRHWLCCFLIVGIYASGISAPLSLFMLFGLSLMWTASFAFLVYQWLSRSINFTSFHSGLCPVPLACSETAEFWVRASRIFLSCSFMLSCMGRPVSPGSTLPHTRGIL